MADKTSIMKTIRACLARAEAGKGATQAEAELAMVMAKKLMAKHNIEMSDLEHKEEVKAGAKEAADFSDRVNKQPWERKLARVCDALFNTEHYYQNMRREKDGRYVPRMVFIGVGHDAALSAEVYTTLAKMIRNMGSKAGYQHGADCNSYCMGVVSALLRRANEKAEGLTPAEENKCTGLMVIKNQVVETHMKSLRLRPARASSYEVRQDAFHTGVAHGNKMNMDFRRALK